MNARKAKDPSGGAGLLLLAGLGLEGVVGLIALQAVGVDAIASAREFVDTTLRDLADDSFDPSTDLVPATPPDEGGSLSDVASSLDIAVEATRPICWDNLAEASDADSLIAFELTIEADGRVSSARVAGASPMLKACLEAEALSWSVPAPGQQLTLVRSVRFAPY